MTCKPIGILKAPMKAQTMLKIMQQTLTTLKIFKGKRRDRPNQVSTSLIHPMKPISTNLQCAHRPSKPSPPSSQMQKFLKLQ